MWLRLSSLVLCLQSDSLEQEVMEYDEFQYQIIVF